MMFKILERMVFKISSVTFFFFLIVNVEATAQKTAGQFDNNFLHVATIDIPDLNHPFFKSEFHFLNDLFCTVDLPVQQIRCFNDQGEKEKIIGGPGRGPGEFGQLIMIDFDTVSKTLVALDVNRRVTFFNEQGEKLTSLLITGSHHNFDVTLAGDDNQYLALGGLPFNSSNYTIEENVGIVHIYDKISGEYIRSFHPTVTLSDRLDFREKISLHGVNMGIIVKTDIDGAVLVMQPLEYSITKYDLSNGEVNKLISNVPEHIKIVNEAIPDDAVNVVKQHDFWHEEPRHLTHNFFVTEFGYTIVVQTFEPSMYTLDIYDRNGSPILVNIPTDKELRAVKGNKFYYTSFSEEKNNYQLQIYKLDYDLKR